MRSDSEATLNALAIKPKGSLRLKKAAKESRIGSQFPSDGLSVRDGEDAAESQICRAKSSAERLGPPKRAVYMLRIISIRRLVRSWERPAAVATWRLNCSVFRVGVDSRSAFNILSRSSGESRTNSEKA